jgi:2-oxoglutarate ferredoxin oxidoreductase subunit beta
MTDLFMDTENLPFCKGCSHHLVARNTDKALQMLGLNPLDVILVTDIGCHGIIDGRFFTHTVHGLHGRSVALGTGIAAGLSNPKKKVIVFIGDGGATIGMSHLIAAAHRNIDMTVIIHNNFLYGMTGGQQSDLTPGEFKTQASIGGFTSEFLDISEIVKSARAAFVSRIVAKGDFSDKIAEAIKTPGFSLIEILEICPSYGLKYNVDLNITNLIEKLAIPLIEHRNENVVKANIPYRENLPSLLDSLKPVDTRFTHHLEKESTIFIGGSAGEGVQVAANIFAQAAISCGLNVTIKSNYPVTVGVGFSAVELILSPNPIRFTGIRNADNVIVSSGDGMLYLKGRLGNMPVGNILADSGIKLDFQDKPVMTADFRKTVKAKEVNILMLMVLLGVSEIFPFEALIEAISSNKISGKLDVNALKEIAENLQKRI